MKGPKGHFLNNLIETTSNFRKKFNIIWILNKNFNSQGTYLPKDVKIYKSISSNFFKRKEKKIFYIFEEIFLFLLNLILIFYFLFIFFKKKRICLYISALRSNYFLLPRYFYSFYFIYNRLNLSPNDHIFFQTARRKDIALINFLTKIDKNHPKFHIRVMLPPKEKFKGFFYYLRLIDEELIKKKVFVYLWSNFTYKLFLKKSKSKKGIFKSNIPWSFKNRKPKKKNHTIGYIGDARKARGFHLLPELISNLEQTNRSFNYLIQFSKISSELIEVKNKLLKMTKKNKKIKIIEKYLDYKDFSYNLGKIDIMPILHSAKEINTITSGTMYTCIPYEIPMILPKGTTFMKKILKYKSFEIADGIEQTANKITKISKNYSRYLNNVKLNSKILKKILDNDPLKKNIK